MLRRRLAQASTRALDRQKLRHRRTSPCHKRRIVPRVSPSRKETALNLYLFRSRVIPPSGIVALLGYSSKVFRPCGAPARTKSNT